MEDDLDRRLSGALGGQRLSAERAAAMARVARRRAPSWGVPAAAAAALVLVVLGTLIVGSPASAESFTVVRRLDRVEVMASSRALPREYVVAEGEFVRVGNRTYGAGTRLVDGRPADGSPDRHAMLDGLCHFAAERWDSAAAEFREDGSADALFYLVAALARAKRFEEAARVGERFLVAHPEYASADLVRYWHAHHLRELGREAEARTMFEELVAKHPSSSLVALARAQSGNGATELWSRFHQAWDAREWGGARAALEELIGRHPQTAADASFYRIACVANAGDETRAIALTDAFVRDHPAHAACDYALYFKAVWLRRAGRAEDARATCRRILVDYPEGGMAPTVRALMEELR